MGITVPYFLIGLVALAIPVIVHLWSKNTRKSIAFGSLRFLRETETKTMRSIMPSQWILLLLRMLLIALLVLLIAEPYMDQKVDKVNTMYLVDPTYKELPWYSSFKDSLGESDKAFWLIDDFPSIEENVEIGNNDYWQLLANPPEEDAERVVVISPLRVSDFKGERTHFPIKYEWIKLPIDPQEVTTISYKKREEAYQVNSTYDEWNITNSIQEIADAEPLEVSYYLESSSAFESYRKMFETAVNTLNELSALTINQTNDYADADWIFWLSTEQPPSGFNVLSIDTLTIQKWKNISDERIHISKDWDMKDAIEQNLPKKLLTLLSPMITNSMDQRTMGIDSFTYQEVEKRQVQYSQQKADAILWLLLLIGLITERWTSFKSEKQ